MPQAKWTSPGDGCKLCDCEELSIRWYSVSCTLNIKEEKADEIKCKLLPVTGDCKNKRTEPSSTRQDCKNLHTKTVVNAPFYTQNNEDAFSFKKFKNQITKFVENTNTKLQSLTAEVNKLESKKSETTLILEDVVKELKTENLKLTKENDDLREKNLNISLIMSGLNTKVKDLE